jgi:hypothetical protein
MQFIEKKLDILKQMLFNFFFTFWRVGIFAENILTLTLVMRYTASS